MPPRGVPRTPSEVELDITNRCNLRCKYCYHFTSAGDVESDLPLDEWLGFFEELGRGAVLRATLCGGEPFCREDFRELVEGIVRNRMRFSVLTNGTRITDELAAFLRSTRRCDSLQVSIDGATSPAHDSMRGEGTLVLAVEGVRTLLRHGLAVTVRVTIHRQNVHELESVARLLLEDLKLPSFSTNTAGCLGMCRDNRDDVELTVEEFSLAMEKLVALRKKYGPRLAAQAGPLAAADAWPGMLAARRRNEPRHENRGYLRSCNGVFRKLGVRADGTYVPCTQLSHIALGRINRDPLETVWREHPELERLRQRQNVPLKTFEECRECGFSDYCTGGCPAMAFALSGTDRRPSPDFCLKHFLEAGGQVPVSLAGEY
jgi:SynChlorMet cassette radical SAM/SPASM protein ScmE